MKIGMVGLGRMGSNMVERLLKGGHEVIAYDLSENSREAIKKKGAEVAASLEDLAKKLKPLRVIWIMVPAGKPTEETIDKLVSVLSEGDIVIDGGNSYYKDSMRRANELKKEGISFLDAGTSGGVWGLQVGYCLMIGGKKDRFKQVEPVFKTLAPKDGYAHVGASGAQDIL